MSFHKVYDEGQIYFRGETLIIVGGGEVLGKYFKLSILSSCFLTNEAHFPLYLDFV